MGIQAQGLREGGVRFLSNDILLLIVDDFESGDVSKWDVVNDLSATTGRVFSGLFSGKCDNAQGGSPQAYIIPDRIEGGSQPSGWQYYWQGTSNSFGAGMRLLNSDGNVELGLASNNPQWKIDDGNGIETVFGGDGNDRWVRFSVGFNWQQGTFSVDLEDTQTGSTYTDSGRPLKEGKDIERVQIDDYSGNWQDGGSIDNWFDEITLSF